MRNAPSVEPLEYGPQHASWVVGPQIVFGHREADLALVANRMGHAHADQIAATSCPWS
ncbi:MAG TPA: hypothetical protein VFO62_01225 [Candidatus Binatia bacterium]|nr:hypothetical protein [Candidatus Binatia bacterium]